MRGPLVSLSLLVLTLLLAASQMACRGNDNNGNPGLYPFQLPINTGFAGRNDPVVTSLRVEPGGGLRLQIGTGVDIRVIGTFSDGSSFDVTGLATFDQTNPSVGTLSLGGQFRAQNPGTTTIFARIDHLFSDAPSAPRNLGGVILPGDRFRLTWDPNPAEDNVIGYVVYRSRTSAVFTFKMSETDPDSAELIQADPIPGTTYTDETAVGGVVYYVVQAIRRDVNDPDVLIYGSPSRQLKVNFATDTVGEED